MAFAYACMALLHTHHNIPTPLLLPYSLALTETLKIALHSYYSCHPRFKGTFYSIYIFIVCEREHSHVLALTHVRRLGYDLQESDLSFSCANPGDQTQVVWLRDFSGIVCPDPLPAAFKGVFTEALCSQLPCPTQSKQWQSLLRSQQPWGPALAIAVKRRLSSASV